MKISGNKDDIGKRVENVAFDLAVPVLALFGGTDGVPVFPYIATRDRVVSLLLRETQCEAILPSKGGRANGAWRVRPGGLLDTEFVGLDDILGKLGETPRSREAYASSNLRAFSDQYLSAIVTQSEGRHSQS